MYYDVNDFENMDEGRDLRRTFQPCVECGAETLHTCEGCEAHICPEEQLKVRRTIYNGYVYTVARCEECAWFEMTPDPEADSRVFNARLKNLDGRIQYWINLSPWDRFVISDREAA